MKHLFESVSAAALLLGATNAGAQTTIATPSSATTDIADDGDVVVTAQRRNETQVTAEGKLGVLGDKSAMDVPFSIRSYNDALILNQQPQTLGQVLENDPTVRTTYGFGNAAEQFVIRGFALTGDDVGFDGLYGITPRQLVAPELYQSVQVLNGATAFLNGAAPGGSSIGGSVNLVPKRAGTSPLARATVNYLSDEHFGGSFDVARRFGANGEWGVRINGAARRGDVSIDDEFRSAYVVGGAIDYTSGPLRLSLDVAYQRVKVSHFRPKLTVNGVIPRVPDADTNYGQPYQTTTLRDVFGEAKAEYDLGDKAMLYASFGARDGSEKGYYSTLTLTNPTTGAATVSGSYIPRTDNNEAAIVGLRVKLGSAITQEFNVGGQASWLVNRNAYEFYAVSSVLNNIYAPITVPQPSRVTFRGGDLDDPFPISRIRLASAFASDTIGFLGDRVLVTGGLRLQQIRTTSYAANASGTLPAGRVTGRYEEDRVTPVVGVVVKPVQGLSLYANRIEGLVQGATAPASGANPAGGSALPVSNAGEILPPFVSTQYEAGVKFETRGFNVAVAAFQIDRDTAILRLDPARPNTLTYGPFGTQRNKGIELTVQAEPVRGLRLIGGGSVIDAKLRRTQNGVNQGNDAVGVPDWLVNANAEWDLPFLRALTLTGRVVYTGEQAANIANTLYLDDWTRFDVGARYVLAIGQTPVTLRGGVDNVANKRYWASAFDTFRPDLLQGMPRTYRASLSVDF